MPALLTRMSTRPSCLLRVGDHGGDLGALGHVGAGVDRLDAEILFDAAALLLDRRGVAEAVDDDVGAFLGEGAGDGQADAAGRAGDQRDFAFETLRYLRVRPSMACRTGGSNGR